MRRRSGTWWPFSLLRQLRKVYSYRTEESPPMPRKAPWPQNGTIPTRNVKTRRNNHDALDPHYPDRAPTCPRQRRCLADLRNEHPAERSGPDVSLNPAPCATGFASDVWLKSIVAKHGLSRRTITPGNSFRPVQRTNRQLIKEQRHPIGMAFLFSVRRGRKKRHPDLHRDGVLFCEAIDQAALASISTASVSSVGRRIM